MKHQVITYLKPYTDYNKSRQYQNGLYRTLPCNPPAHNAHIAHNPRSYRFLTLSAFDLRPYWIRVVAAPTDHHISSANHYNCYVIPTGEGAPEKQATATATAISENFYQPTLNTC
jgi:hypothetical protein